MGDEPNYKTHPAYGMVAFSRVQGNPGKMFGSSLPQHGHFVRMAVKPAQRKHDLGQDWIMGANCCSYVEVWLSASQFSELLTTMNIGDGVPCTIKRVNGEQVEDMPADEVTEADRTYEAARTKMEIFTDELKIEIQKATKMLLAKGTITVKDRREVVGLLNKVLMETGANMPFALQCFQEAVEKTSTQAKAELDAMVSHVITTKGLESLGIEPKQLEDKQDE